MGEATVQRLVAAWLRESFADVEHEPRLPATGRVPDFIAHTPFESYVIEVEHGSFEDLFTGLGQAYAYAQFTDHTPVVVLPADEVEDPEFTELSTGPIRIVTL